MSDPETAFFSKVYEANLGNDIDETTKYFHEEQARDPTARNATLEDYARYWMQRYAETREAERQVEGPSASVLWDAVRVWQPDPMSNSPNAHPKAILDYLYSKRKGPVPLGKFQGQYMCQLEPMVALEPDDDFYWPELPFSISNRKTVRAIKYADGHPSEGQIHLVDAQDGTSAGQDNILRRFIGIGFVHMYIRDKWVKTGHALVLDASHGRDKHPWFVLAREWETDDEELIMTYDSQYLQPPEEIGINDHKALGMLPIPGSRNRTPIAPLIHIDGVKKPGSFFEYFGPDFSFDLGIMGKDQPKGTYPRQPRGPDLCEIMNWHFDTAKNREVCFTKHGIEYISYDPDNKKYHGPGLPSEDEVGSIMGEALGAREMAATSGDTNLGPPEPGSSRDQGRP